MRRGAFDTASTEGSGRGWLLLPGLLLSGLVMALVTPVWVPLAWVSDRIGKGGRSWCAGWLTLLALVGVELAVVARAAALWWTCGAPWNAREDGYSSYGNLLCWWAKSALNAIVRVNGMRVDVEGLEEADLQRNHLLLMRHVSVFDALLPRGIFAAKTGVAIREVWKRELLWVPSLHFAGRRLPHVGVSREDASSAEKVNEIAALGAELAPGEGLAVFPEGARFSPARRNHVIRHLEGSQRQERLEEAKALRHLLPIRTGSTRALMDRRGNADVWLCGHTGFEHAFSLSDLFRGGLQGRTLRVRFWCHSGADVPADPDAAVAWVRSGWGTVDAWLNEVKMSALAEGAEASPGSDDGESGPLS